MLTMSYAQALADPTYCDTGRTGGAELVKLFGVKKNEARPLKEILPHVTVAELLWCLRVVKVSQVQEASALLRGFMADCLMRVPNNILDERAMKVYSAIKKGADILYSQNAIDVSAAAIQYARFSGREAEEEQAQRAWLGMHL